MAKLTLSTPIAIASVHTVDPSDIVKLDLSTGTAEGGIKGVDENDNDIKAASVQLDLDQLNVVVQGAGVRAALGLVDDSPITVRELFSRWQLAQGQQDRPTLLAGTISEG